MGSPSTTPLTGLTAFTPNSKEIGEHILLLQLYH